MWILCVQDATVVLECLRREFNTTRDIAIFFLRRGTPFTLAFEGIRPNVLLLISVKQTRPSDFIPMSAHFLEWENTAREFMQTPRSHLVWKVGGFFWRLALYLVGTTEPALALFDMAPGIVTHYVTPTAYEETLTEEEMDLMMGVFHIRSSRSVSVRSTMTLSNLHSEEDETQLVTRDLSYWPHPRHIQGSSFDAACWAPSNESWFIDRIEGLRAAQLS